jgi:hypothetical protein
MEPAASIIRPRNISCDSSVYWKSENLKTDSFIKIFTENYAEESKANLKTLLPGNAVRTNFRYSYVSPIFAVPVTVHYCLDLPNF